tara:strand:- start:7186 stop:7377 length:192 start_codon:yes stop_codon:yes gene_type:complete
MTKSKKLSDVLPGGKKNRKKRKRQHQELCNMMGNLLSNKKTSLICDEKKVNDLASRLKSKVSI